MNKFFRLFLDSSLRWNDIIYACHSRENGNLEKFKELINSFSRMYLWKILKKKSNYYQRICKKKS